MKLGKEGGERARGDKPFVPTSSQGRNDEVKQVSTMRHVTTSSSGHGGGQDPGGSERALHTLMMSIVVAAWVIMIIGIIVYHGVRTLLEPAC